MSSGFSSSMLFSAPLTGARRGVTFARMNLREQKSSRLTHASSAMLSGERNRRSNMLIKSLRFLSLVCAALVLGLTLTHDLEIPGKHLLSAAEWLAIQHTFYGGFAIVGGSSEILGLLTTSLLLFFLRKQRVALALTLVAALCFAGTLALFVFGNN